MSYKSITRHPDDPQIGLNDPRRDPDESIDEALIAKLQRRNKVIRKRMAELKNEYGDQLPPLPPATA